MSYKYMPVGVSMGDRRWLVVGGGSIALRKIEILMDYDTKITVVAPEVHEKLEYHASQGRITVERREYRSSEAKDYDFVICATDDKAVNQGIYEDTRLAGVLVNVVDDPVHCDFVFPAVLRRDCLTAAISTDGRAPFVAGHLRIVLEEIFPVHWERLMKHATSFRKMVRERWAGDPEKRNACYTEFLEAEWKRILTESNDAEVAEELERMIEMPASSGD
jgi:siroheme synthase-like protein